MKIKTDKETQNHHTKKRLEKIHFFRDARKEFETGTDGDIKKSSLFGRNLLIRTWNVMWEFYSGIRFLKKTSIAATFFGSARECCVDQKYYDAAEKLAGELSKRGVAIITGGAGGMMNCANKGSYANEGTSIGLNIHLQSEQEHNKYLTHYRYFRYFFIRKVMLSYASEMYIYFPGGFGTLDELFEILTLVQTEKIPHVPIILFGKNFWGPIVDVIEKHLYEKYSVIDEKDQNFYIMVDSVEEACMVIDELLAP